MSLVKGFHHITLCAGGAQEDLDFCTQVLGQRLIKQTILFDGRFAHYHLYYSNADAEPGSVLTTFPYSRVPGRPGSGQIGYSVLHRPQGERAVLDRSPQETRHQDRREVELFGEKMVRFHHPSGLGMAVVENADRQAQGLDHSRNSPRCGHARLLRHHSFGSGSRRDGALLRRRAGL